MSAKPSTVVTTESLFSLDLSRVVRKCQELSEIMFLKNKK